MAGRALRVLAELAGFVGAEITGAFGAAAGVAVTAFDWPPTRLGGFILVPLLMAGAGPVGYDMAQSWVPEDESLPVAAPGSRTAVHVAGAAGALVLCLVCSALALASRSAPIVVLSWLVVLSLPYLAAVGRRIALRRFSGAGPLLAVSAVVGVCAAFAFWLVVIFAVAGMAGDD